MPKWDENCYCKEMDSATTSEEMGKRKALKPERKLGKTVYFSEIIFTWARENMAHHAFGPSDFSRYIEWLIRQDRQRISAAPGPEGLDAIVRAVATRTGNAPGTAQLDMLREVAELVRLIRGEGTGSTGGTPPAGTPAQG